MTVSSAEAHALLEIPVSGFSLVPPAVGTAKKLACSTGGAVPLEIRTFTRETCVLTLLKYEPVSVFYVINCDCQFPLQGEE